MLNIHFLDDSTGFVLAGNATVIDSLRGRQFIFKTTDARKTWVRYPCKFPTVHDGIANFIPLDQSTLIGVGGSVYKSVNNGYDWVNLYPDHVEGCTVWDISPRDSLNWILADCSFITRITDGGKNWKQVYHNTYFPAPFPLLSFPSKTVGYSCGGSNDDYFSGGFIIKTVDGGQNWTMLNPEPWHSNNELFPDVRDIQFINDETGFIFTAHDKIYKTKDGGESWELLVPNIDFLFLNVGYFTDEDTGFCAAQNQIYETDDGGETWNIGYTNLPKHGSVDMNYLGSGEGFIVDMEFSGSGEGYAITYDSKILQKIN